MLDCAPDGACYVAIENFYIPKLAAACTTAECLVEGYSLQAGGAAAQGACRTLVLACALLGVCGGNPPAVPSARPQAGTARQRRRATTY